MHAKTEEAFGLNITGKPNLKKVVDYIVQRQEIIRKHENATAMREQGVNIALGEAKFTGKKEVPFNNTKYNARNIVIATGSKPRELNVPGVENVNYFTNSSIFSLENLPQNLLVIGGGPIGIELAQAFNSIGKKRSWHVNHATSFQNCVIHSLFKALNFVVIFQQPTECIFCPKTCPCKTFF